MNLDLPSYGPSLPDGSKPTVKQPKREGSFGKRPPKNDPAPGRAPEHRIGARLRSWVLERDKGRCVLCGRSAMDTYEDGTHVILHVDHIIPVAQGGVTAEENLATLCGKDNLGKGARISDIMRAIGHALKPTPEAPKEF